MFRTEWRRNEQTWATSPWLVRTSAMVNHFYVYGPDRDISRFFLKFCAYLPYDAKLSLNTATTTSNNNWASAASPVSR